MENSFQTNYKGERYYCASAEIDSCGEETTVESLPEFLFLDGFMKVIADFIINKVNIPIEFSLFEISESSQLAIVARPQTITGLGIEGQVTIPIQFDIVCSDSELSLQGGVANAATILMSAIKYAKTKIGFQYSYNIGFISSDEASVSLEIRKKLI